MSFAWPHLLWLLAVPAALLAWELMRRRRSDAVLHPKILRAEAGLRTVTLSDRPASGVSLSRRRLLLCAGAAFAILALARPQWGRLDEQVFDQSREIIIALDLSRSMLTPDVKPSRLERAKLLIQSLLDRLHGERVGLIVFSGTAYLQSPVSADYEILREFLPSLGPDFLPEGGTNYRQLIDTAVDAFGEGTSADRYLIILSDGEATDDDWKGQIGTLARHNIRVIGLGVGTSSGGMIPDGSGGFMKDDKGAVVLSKLENGTLRQLAAATHGTYRDASEWVDLARVLASTVDEGRKGRFVEHNTLRLVERYQWALGPALLCFLASFWLEFPVRPKSRQVRLSGPGAERALEKPVLAALAAAALFLLPARSPAADTRAPDPAASLAKVVGRLSSQRSCSALDWAEFVGDTVIWGQHLQTGKTPVPERPVRDALDATDIGLRSDPKAADWPKLRSQLEELLKKQEDKKQQDQKKNPEDKKNQDQNKDQKQDEKQGQKQDDKQDQDSKKPESESGSPDKPQEQNGEPQKQPESGRPSQDKAFGDLSKPSPAPLSREEPKKEMQRVGGVKKDQPIDPAQRDPELAVPLEKLEQVKGQDSPAELFEMLRKGEQIPPPTNKGPNW